MSRFHSYCNTAVVVLSAYDGQEPFSLALKRFFAGEKKYGSRDRKIIAHLCYCYFRTAILFEEGPMEEKIIKGLFLCSTGQDEILQQLRPEWDKKTHLAPGEKLQLLSSRKTIRHLFPFSDELSEGIDISRFSLSHLIQPDLFLRARPGFEAAVVQKLRDAGVSFQTISDTCIALPNATKVEQIIELNMEAVVQDLSSQRVVELMIRVRRGPSDRALRVWDCCAASGGKSILAKDVFGKIDLTVSDIRESILHNLKKRFGEAGIKNYKSFIADLESPTPDSRPDSYRVLTPDSYDLIIADVPCTGSGTWSRTPEQLYFFDVNKIEHYTGLQKKILTNALTCLKPGGYLLYITCSVFKKENEEMLEFLQEKFDLHLEKMELLKGYDKKADTMFAALLSLPKHEKVIIT